jgi:hypothetical protein
MTIAGLAQIEGRRRSQNLAGGGVPIQAKNFSMGNVTLDPEGGQVPWRNQEQGEVCSVIEGTGEMCLGAYATFELECGVVAHFNSSWVTRVRRDDLPTVQVDGEKGSAVCGLRDAWIQRYANTPRPAWKPATTPSRFSGNFSCVTSS